MNLIFDTETTGLSATRRLVQLAWEKRDPDGVLISKYNFMIKPNAFMITNSHIHGITTEKALAYGHKLRIVLELFMSELLDVTNIIGHNLKFDVTTILIELKKCNILDNPFEAKILNCTLSMSRNLYKLKSHKLGDVYFKLFAETFDGAHTADQDTFACSKIYYFMSKNITISE